MQTNQIVKVKTLYTFDAIAIITGDADQDELLVRMLSWDGKPSSVTRVNRDDVCPLDRNELKQLFK